MSDARTDASPVVSVLLGGRKLVGMALALAALVWGPEAAYGSVVTAFGVYVGGNGFEHFTRKAPSPPAAAIRDREPPSPPDVAEPPGRAQ